LAQLDYVLLQPALDDDDDDDDDDERVLGLGYSKLN
jgi:hypothetical protein